MFFSLELLSWVFVLIVPFVWRFRYLLIQRYFLLLGLIGLSCRNRVLLFSLLLKLGFPPSHIWFIKIRRSLNITYFIFLLTFHKLLPLFFLRKMMFFKRILGVLFILLVITAGITANRSFLLITFVFSSIAHRVWILIRSLLRKGFILLYWALYRFIRSLLLRSLTLKTIKNLFLGHGRLASLSWIILSGFPPFVIFWLKLNILSFLLLEIGRGTGGLVAFSRVFVLRAYFRTWYLNQFLLSPVLTAWGTVLTASFITRIIFFK